METEVQENTQLEPTTLPDPMIQAEVDELTAKVDELKVAYDSTEDPTTKQKILAEYSATQTKLANAQAALFASTSTLFPCMPPNLRMSSTINKKPTTAPGISEPASNTTEAQAASLIDDTFTAILTAATAPPLAGIGAAIEAYKSLVGLFNVIIPTKEDLIGMMCEEASKQAAALAPEVQEQIAKQSEESGFKSFDSTEFSTEGSAFASAVTPLTTNEGIKVTNEIKTLDARLKTGQVDNVEESQAKLEQLQIKQTTLQSEAGVLPVVEEEPVENTTPYKCIPSTLLPNLPCACLEKVMAPAAGFVEIFSMLLAPLGLGFGAFLSAEGSSESMSYGEGGYSEGGTDVGYRKLSDTAFPSEESAIRAISNGKFDKGAVPFKEGDKWYIGVPLASSGSGVTPSTSSGSASSGAPNFTMDKISSGGNKQWYTLSHTWTPGIVKLRSSPSPNLSRNPGGSDRVARLDNDNLKAGSNFHQDNGHDCGLVTGQTYSFWLQALDSSARTNSSSCRVT